MTKSSFTCFLGHFMLLPVSGPPHIGAILKNSSITRKFFTGSGPEIEIFNSEYPFYVALLNNGIHICGASILTKDMILTAAHCVYNIVNPSNMETFVQRRNIEKGPLIMGCLVTLRHDHFNETNLLLKKSTCKFFSFQKNICSLAPKYKTVKSKLMDMIFTLQE